MLSFSSLKVTGVISHNILINISMMLLSRWMCLPGCVEVTVVVHGCHFMHV